MSNTIIRWQYPNEEPVQIIGADSYDFEEIKQPCTGLRHQIKYGIAQIGTTGDGECYLVGYTQQYYLRQWIGFDDPPFTNFRFYVNNILKATAATPEDLFDENGKPVFEHWSYRAEYRPDKCGEPPYGNSKAYSVKFDSATRKDLNPIRPRNFGFVLLEFGVEDPYNENAPPPQCPPDKCKFVVYDGNREVYQRTEEVCPQVQEFEFDECPPGTCPVPCGSFICCYQRNGISIKRIPR